ncbi:MAG: SCP2 sterol-binding domain-containing protein [Anaerolineae bacterium]|nr:SCP2 sterol-binding domain-containing protein [Anaerolineae bacterium]MCO5189663.1 SCP2 sterol-binding domain-containing protein [Anaerolineae bacterium]MCO5192375.1 SCP2 sterol-binding domain-containing protein [Anaerolineae bacterium]MCO5198489.1 SCP2 sterol-binding domain-containing protein [Anaerolineae bacterium]MCO5203855.1 SCP2 sterol-binding domain-containing protein [Anaerolineae bacterium]
MTYEFMSNGWAKAYQDILNHSAAYRDAAANWEGDFYFVCLPLETTSTPLCAYLDLWHGECREAAHVTDQAVRKPEFVISATLPVWQDVLSGKLDPIKGLMSRQLKLQGNMIKVLKAPKAAVEMVNCAMLVDTTWPAR